MKLKTKEYNANDIQILEGLAPVRKRPGMYIGSTGKQGLHHLVYEILDNSVDEALAGFCTKIFISINKDGSVTIEDNGRGMPVDIHPEKGISATEVVHTVLHAGGKFNSSSYKVSGGLHGVGASVVNALSKKMKVEVFRNGYAYEIVFKEGKTVKPLTKKRKVKKTGTRTTFWPDETIFSETTEYDFDFLNKKAQETAFLNKNLAIELEDKREGKERKEKYKFSGGIAEYVAFLNENKTVTNKDIFYCEKEERKEAGLLKGEIALQYTNTYSENVRAYANNIHTAEGGYHLTGFKSGLSKAINNYARRHNVIKKNDDISLSGDDIREGLTAVISIKLSNAEFEGQTKAKLGNTEAKGFMETLTYEFFSGFLEEKPSQAKAILNKCMKARKARIAAKKARDVSRKSTAVQSASLPGKLADCSCRDASKTEIFLVEGDSAGGSAKQGRDRRTQAVLPLRGKILNVQKAGLSKILNSEEIKNMITAFGCGIGKSFKIDDLRYDKIIIMTDADVDGAHIRTLLLTFLYKFMRPLIENGHVYVAQPPLFRTTQGKKEYYTYSDGEQETLLKKLRQKQGKVDIQRYKGLGEMSFQQLWETTMDYSSRTLLRITLDDCDENNVERVFETLMGSDAAARKTFIKENAKFADNIDT